MMNVKFAHVNLIAENWRMLADFYIKVFSCKPKPPERDLSGEWLDNLTGLKSTTIKGIHLLFPGYDNQGPTLEIFEYKSNEKADNKPVNREGFGHIAFAVDNVESCLALLLENGGSTAGKVVDADIEDVGRINLVYARDPEGNIVEIQKWG